MPCTFPHPLLPGPPKVVEDDQTIGLISHHSTMTKDLLSNPLWKYHEIMVDFSPGGVLKLFFDGVCGPQVRNPYPCLRIFLIQKTAD